MSQLSPVVLQLCTYGNFLRQYQPFFAMHIMLDFDVLGGIMVVRAT